MSQSCQVARSSRSQVLSPEGPLKAVENLTHAWMQKDLRGMSRQLSDDITELGPAFPKPLVGKRNFFEKYQAYFSSSLQIESYRILSPCLIYLTPRLALVHFRYRMKSVTRSSIEKSSGQESMLVEFRRGRWRVRFIHWHRRLP